MSDAFNGLFGQPDGSEVVSTPETVVEAPVEQVAEGPVRGPDGKFAARPSETPETPETAPVVAPEPARPDPKHVPVGALQEERQRRQAAEALLEANERELAEFRAKTTPVPPEEQHQAELHKLRQQTERLSVEVEHGRAAVKEAYEWAFARCDKDSDKFDPAFNAQMHAQIGLIGNPYQAAVEAYKHHTELAEFNAWKATRNAPPSPDAPPAQIPQQVSEAVPRSLANAPGNGAAGKPHVVIGAEQPYEAIFNR